MALCSWSSGLITFPHVAIKNLPDKNVSQILNIRLHILKGYGKGTELFTADIIDNHCTVLCFLFTHTLTHTRAQTNVHTQTPARTHIQR